MIKEEITDYFEYPELIPAKVMKILDKYEEEFGDSMDYQDTANMHDEIYALGWTFESGLDNVMFNLRPIK